MSFHSFRNAASAFLLALSSALLLAGCGGGGAAADTQGSVVRIFPATGTIYAGVPATFSVVGGRAPYTMSSSEPSLLPVPNPLNSNSFTVIPANPGVIDAGLKPDELQRRTVVLTARDATGLQALATIAVGQNFLTGYGLALVPTNCPAGTGATANTACAGGTTAVHLQATFAGNLHGNEAFRLEVVRGNFALRHPVTGAVSNTITVNSDHTGTVMGLIEVPLGVPRQVAVIRTIHVATGVYADQAFVIDGTPLPGSEALTAIPNEFSFTGVTTLDCGTGIGDFYVYGGQPPFNVVSSDVTLIVTPTRSTSNPGRFTLAATNPNTCLTNATLIVTDALGQRATVRVSTTTGSTAPPAPTPITISPQALTLICNSSGSVSVIGGAGALSVNSSHPRVTAIVSGSTLTITRIAGDGTTVYPTAATISVTDGREIATVTATVPATCP
ncbi:MAG TPA: hypothetical protein VFK48_06785 [Usitatibacter sp.]|nr:hypothetical protein [Usitatibacter sp.]